MNKHFGVLALMVWAIPCLAGNEEVGCKGLTDTAVGAALGRPIDTYNLAVEFYTGRCVAKDYGNAALLWEKASAAGLNTAKNNLAYLLFEGLGVAKDLPRAAQLWREAAVAGMVESQLHLGTAYFNGWGVPMDRARGLAWVLQAIESPPGSDDLGVHAKVVEAAREEKAWMLTTAPDILQAAQALVATLGVVAQTR